MKEQRDHRAFDLRHQAVSSFSLEQRLARLVWSLAWRALFLPSPVPWHAWRRLLLRAFGAKIGPGVHVYPSAKVWAPWNLSMAEGASLAPGVDCYNVGLVELGAWAVVSQRAFLCTASHDIRSASFELIHAPIKVGANAWVAAEALVGPGVRVGEGAVVAARAVVMRSVAPWQVVAGNPARRIGKRRIRLATRVDGAV